MLSFNKNQYLNSFDGFDLLILDRQCRDAEVLLVEVPLNTSGTNFNSQ